MKKLPYGISNYEELITENYYYVDKTKYIEKLENLPENEKIYVIIDEYDHLANELLGFNTDKFKNLITKNRKVRKWYEVLKEGTETVVDRIFITGVAPITLDSLTSGFNICSDKTYAGSEILNEKMN